MRWLAPSALTFWFVIGMVIFAAILVLLETLAVRSDRLEFLVNWTKPVLKRLNQAAVIVLFTVILLAALFLVITRIVEPVAGFFNGSVPEEKLKVGAAVGVVGLLAIFAIAFALLFIGSLSDDVPRLRTEWGGFGEGLGGWEISKSLAYLIGALAFAIALAAVSVGTLQPAGESEPAATPSPTPTPSGAERSAGPVTSSANPVLSYHPSLTYAPTVSCGSTSNVRSRHSAKQASSENKCPPNAVSPGGLETK